VILVDYVLTNDKENILYVTVLVFGQYIKETLLPSKMLDDTVMMTVFLGIKASRPRLKAGPVIECITKYLYVP
jgi:hypothetical protein